MNTKTMRLPPRRVLTTNKRKERDDPWPKPITKFHKPEKPIPKPTSEPTSEPIKSSPATSSGGGKAVIKPMPSNHLLAGYLAHEFLTKGTLMGHQWAPPRAEKVTIKDEMESKEGGAAAETPCRKLVEDEKVHEKERYAGVAALLKGGRAHLPGVVNPTQLSVFCSFD